MEVFREEIRSKFGRQCGEDALRLASRPQGQILSRQGELLKTPRSMTLETFVLVFFLRMCLIEGAGGTPDYAYMCVWFVYLPHSSCTAETNCVQIQRAITIE